MARIVMKFGGTSMAGTERIRTVAKLVAREVANGNEVAVVVSAMAGETDRLVNFCREANPRYDPAEYDVVVAAGEQVTSGLLALTLQAMGVPARSWLGWQLPIRTEEAHARARILDIDTGALLTAMGKGEVAVIPGFQGMMDDGRVSTLGRGGSDTSAVAVAAALYLGLVIAPLPPRESVFNGRRGTLQARLAVQMYSIIEDVYGHPDIDAATYLAYREASCGHRNAGRKVPRSLDEVVLPMRGCQAKHGARPSAALTPVTLTV